MNYSLVKAFYIIIFCCLYGGIHSPAQAQSKKLVVYGRSEIIPFKDDEIDKLIRELGSGYLTEKLERRINQMIRVGQPVCLPDSLEVLNRDHLPALTQAIKYENNALAVGTVMDVLTNTRKPDYFLFTRIGKPIGTIGWVRVQAKILDRRTTLKAEAEFDLLTAYLVADSIDPKIDRLADQMVDHLVDCPSQLISSPLSSQIGTFLYGSTALTSIAFSQLYYRKEANLKRQMAEDNLTEASWRNYVACQTRSGYLAWTSLHQLVNMTPFILDWTGKGPKLKKWHVATYYLGSATAFGILGGVSGMKTNQVLNALANEDDPFTRIKLNGDLAFQLEKRNIFYANAALDVLTALKVMLLFRKEVLPRSVRRQQKGMVALFDPEKLASLSANVRPVGNKHFQLSLSWSTNF